MSHPRLTLLLLASCGTPASAPETADVSTATLQADAHVVEATDTIVSIEVLPDSLVRQAKPGQSREM